MDSIQTFLLSVGVLGGLGGFAALADVYLRRNKTKAEEKKLGIDGDVSISDRALEMYKLARAEAQEAKLGAEFCRDKVDALEDHIDLLKHDMRKAGLNPPPFQFPGFAAWREARV